MSLKNFELKYNMRFVAFHFSILNHRLVSLLISEKMSDDRKQQDRSKKKESILELNKYLDKAIRVKFQGGREASGILKG